MERIPYNKAPKGLYDTMYEMGNYLEESGLDPQLIKLIDLRVSQINGCAFCLDMHYKEARYAGESELRLSLILTWRETDIFSEKERAVLAYSEALTELNHAVDDKVYDELTRHFSNDEIACLTMAVVRINSWNRYMLAFKITPGRYEVAKEAA